jgi:hypothetical protein
MVDTNMSTSSISRLFDNNNVTCDDQHMWLCPFRAKERIRVTIILNESKHLYGLRIWNYNKSSDDIHRGVNFNMESIDCRYALFRLNDFTFNYMTKGFHRNKDFSCDVHLAIVVSILHKTLSSMKIVGDKQPMNKNSHR